MAALVKYKYLGLSTVVHVDYSQPQVRLDLWGGAPGAYTGIDCFGRVIDHRWLNYDTDEDVARIQHGYDRDSNRLWRQNDVARSLNKKFDQQYTYDGFNRLSDFKQGLLDGNKTIPANDLTFRQRWGLDKLGNWSQFDQDSTGAGTYDLEQTRNHNAVNEITDIGATAGPVWPSPRYDPAGNTTEFPKPADPTSSYTAVYDAWNRMVRVLEKPAGSSSSSSSGSEGSASPSGGGGGGGSDELQVVQENVYDGRGYRIIKKTYENSQLDETRHIYYTSSWQVIEERLGENPDTADAERQFVWGTRYIDDLVLRDRDASQPLDGTLEERLYAVQDANWNVTTIVDDSGDVQERYEYEAYGEPLFFGTNWNIAPIAGFDWNTLCSGQPLDRNLRLYNIRFRIPCTSIGRWLQRDEQPYSDSFNLYLLLVSHPVDTLDPLGLQADNGADASECCAEFGMRFRASGPAVSLVQTFADVLEVGGTPNAPKGKAFLGALSKITAGGTVAVDTVMSGAICCGEILWIIERVNARLNNVKAGGILGNTFKDLPVNGTIQLTFVWDHRVGWGKGPTDDRGALAWIISDPNVGKCMKREIEGAFEGFLGIIRKQKNIDPLINMSFKVARWNKRKCPKPQDCDREFPRPATFEAGDLRVFDLDVESKNMIYHFKAVGGDFRHSLHDLDHGPPTWMWRRPKKPRKE